MSEQKNDPIWKPNLLKQGEEIIVTLENANPVASGVSKYGEWNLWILQVENTTVLEKGSNKKIENYTGKTVCFPPKGMNKEFLKFTNGTKENVKVGITKNFKEVEGQNVPMTVYDIRSIDGGSTPPSNLTDKHYQFIKTFKTLVKKNIINNAYEDLKGLGNTDTWKITDEEMLKKIWNVCLEK